RPGDALAQLRWNELRHRRRSERARARRSRIAHPQRCGAIRRGFRRAPGSRRFAGILRWARTSGYGRAARWLVAVPHGIGRRLLRALEHECGRPPALAGRDLRHGAAGSNRTVFGEKRGGFPLVARVLVAMLDEEPVRALRLRIVAHANEHPAALQTLAMQREFELAACQRSIDRKRSFGLPVAAIPELHRAAAVLAGRDGAFEVAIVQRMILD